MRASIWIIFGMVVALFSHTVLSIREASRLPRSHSQSLPAPHLQSLPASRSQSLPARLDYSQPRAQRLWARLQTAAERRTQGVDYRALVYQGLRDSINSAAATAWNHIRERDRVHAVYKSRLLRPNAGGPNKHVIREYKDAERALSAKVSAKLARIVLDRERLQRLTMTKTEGHWFKRIDRNIVGPLRMAKFLHSTEWRNEPVLDDDRHL